MSPVGAGADDFFDAGDVDVDGLGLGFEALCDGVALPAEDETCAVGDAVPLGDAAGGFVDSAVCVPAALE